MYDPREPRFFRAQRIPVPVIHDLHIGVHAGEIVAIVGASGSGKTLLADSIMGLFEPNATVRGRIWFNGVEQNATSLAALRGNGISLVPQSVNYLDPLMKIGNQIKGTRPRQKGTVLVSRFSETQEPSGCVKSSPFRHCEGAKRPRQSIAAACVRGLPRAGCAVARNDGIKHQPPVSVSSPSVPISRGRSLEELLARYDLPPEVIDRYPHELSGGMARRVLLCCALMDGPQVIIADEPTPGLDLELAQRALADFRGFADEGGGVLLITHDIELALRVADRVAVFESGTVIEETAVANFVSPDTLQHPFSKALWHALPEHDFCETETEGDGSRVSLQRGCQGDTTAGAGCVKSPLSRHCERAQRARQSIAAACVHGLPRAGCAVARNDEISHSLPSPFVSPFVSSEQGSCRLEIRDLRFAYPGQPALFDGLNLTVGQQERVALVAPSGAGKSTLCKLLAGYLTPQSGSILANGATLPRKGICPVQLIWQHPERALDSHLRMSETLDEAGTVTPEPRETLIKSCHAVLRPFSRLAALSNGNISSASPAVTRLARHENDSPSGATAFNQHFLRQKLGIRDEWLSRYPHELSGGELQRFCIARALAAHPRYLIADEISTMLDAVTQARIWKVLLEACAAQDIGLVFVSHSPALTARLATRVIEL
jgi:peptide/nickel transport system ATP-binding protein